MLTKQDIVKLREKERDEKEEVRKLLIFRSVEILETALQQALNPKKPDVRILLKLLDKILPDLTEQTIIEEIGQMKIEEEQLNEAILNYVKSKTNMQNVIKYVNKIAKQSKEDNKGAKIDGNS